MTIKSETLYTLSLKGAANFTNICWAFILLLGSSGFLTLGIFSYLNPIGLMPSTSTGDIQFIPQGLVMSFYGTAGLFLGSYLWLTIFFNIGSGYNEVDLKKGCITLFRWGFPGNKRKNRIRCLFYNIKAIQVNSTSLFGQPAGIVLELKGAKKLLFYSTTNGLKLENLEQEAAELAQYLNIPLKTNN
jgi:hypothetical protein